MEDRQSRLFRAGLTRGSLTYNDGHFLCLGEYGQLPLLKVNVEKYEPVGDDLLGTELGPDVAGTVKLKYSCRAAPVVSRGLLYVRGDDELVCLELVK